MAFYITLHYTLKLFRVA